MFPKYQEARLSKNDKGEMISAILKKLVGLLPAHQPAVSLLYVYLSNYNLLDRTDIFKITQETTKSL